MTNIPTGVPREIICADKHFYTTPKSAIKKRERNVMSERVSGAPAVFHGWKSEPRILRKRCSGPDKA